MAKPFLKWPGCKTKLVPHIVPLIQRTGRSYYFEPFLGSGAVFFALNHPGSSYLSDSNADVIGAFLGVKYSPVTVIGGLEALADEYSTGSKDAYIKIRDTPGSDSFAAKAARIVFLQRTCFNGLYRVNRAGKYNVPWGRRPFTFSPSDILEASRALCGDTHLHTHGFEGAIDVAALEGDSVVYCDPPYLDMFDSYTKTAFDHVSLRRKLVEADTAGVRFVLSYNDCEPIREMYSQFVVDTVDVPSSISATKAGRGVRKELLIRNFQ